MHRATTLLAALSLVACGNETDFIDELDLEPSQEPAPVEAVTQTDLLVQTVTPSVDILYMVDNSCSMGDDQADLAANFPTFMRWFLGSGLDYNIGVVSSDTRDPAHNGKLQGGFNKRWISTDDDNQIAAFQQMAVLGNSGASPEKGIAGVYNSKNVAAAVDWNQGFYRDTSALHVIAVSDERDYTRGGDGVTIGEFIDWFDGLKRNADERTFSAIESPAVGASGAGGQAYGTVTQVIGGVVWDIGQEDWSPALDVLGLRASGRKTEYFLSQLPLDETIRVTVRVETEGGNFDERIYPRAFWQGAELVDDEGNPTVGPHWYYIDRRNSITFVDYVPEDLSQVAIEYTIRSSVVEAQEPAGDN